jgi:DNA-binding transcriptional LysR family regulator
VSELSPFLKTTGLAVTFPRSATGALVTLLDELQPPALPVNLVYTSGRFLPIKLRAFLDFATPRLKARLWSIADNGDRRPV